MATRQHWGVCGYVVSPCDEQDEQGKLIRTWDVMRNDVAVSNGHRTRRIAQADADRLNAS